MSATSTAVDGFLFVSWFTFTRAKVRRKNETAKFLEGKIAVSHIL